MSELLLKNCEIVNADGAQYGSILIEDGKIRAILPASDTPSAETTIDLGGRPVIPGVIDSHTHLGNIGPLEPEIKAESRSAAVMGITTVMNFLMNMDSYKDLIPESDRVIEESSMVDVWHHAVIMTDEQFGEMQSYIEDYDIASFKFFMAYKGADALPFLRGIDDGMLLEALQLLAQYPHVVPMVHAENIELVNRTVERVKATGREDLAAWSEARPNIAEEEAQLRAWFFARKANSRLLIVHMSAGNTVEQLAKQRREYPHLYGETCPQYLGLHDHMDLGSFGKCNPPVRDARNAEQLWQGLADGTIDVVGSDHAPWPRAMKEGSLWDAGPGLTSMPSILPVLLSEGVNAGRLTMQQLVRVTSYNAAKIYGLLPTKGIIDVGADADLTVVDLSWKRTYTPANVASSLDWSPFDGIEYTGWPTMTVKNGRVVVERGELVDDTVRGRRLRSNVARTAT